MSHWDEVSQPILNSVSELEPNHEFLDERDLARHLGMDERLARREIQRLYEAAPPYVTGMDNSSASAFHLVGIRLTERGLRQTQVWPSSDSYEELLRLLDDKIREEPDPQKRSKLAALRSSVSDVGKDALGGVLATLIRHGMGI